MKNFLRKLTGFSSKSLEKGFSLAEVMVSVAILGVVIMATVSQLQLSSKSATDMAADAEINNVTNKIISAIGTTEVCRKNFGGNIQEVASYDSIKDANDVDLIVKGGTVGVSNGEIKVLSIATKKVTENEMLLVLSFQKKRFGLDMLLGGPKREIPINTILDALPPTVGHIVECFANYDLVIKTAIQQSCKGNSSFYNAAKNPPYGACEHKALALPLPGSECGAGEFLKSVETTAGKEVKFICEKLTQDCPEGKAITGFAADGTVKCDYIFPACALGQVIIKVGGKHVCTDLDCSQEPVLSGFSGFNSTTGKSLCTKISTQLTCEDGKYATKVEANGDVVCSASPFSGGNCGLGKYISGINNDGSVKCTQWVQVPFNCPGPNQGITGIKADGTPDCEPVDATLKCGAGTHTYRQCEAAGGYVVPGTNSHCKFRTAGACPNTWTKCGVSGGYKTLNGVACWDTSNTFYCDQWKVFRAIPVTAGNGQYADQTTPAATNITCHHWVGTPGTHGRCDDTIVEAPRYVTQEDVGCY